MVARDAAEPGDRPGMRLERREPTSRGYPYFLENVRPGFTGHSEAGDTARHGCVMSPVERLKSRICGAIHGLFSSRSGSAAEAHVEAQAEGGVEPADLGERTTIFPALDLVVHLIVVWMEIHARRDF